jgi:hypothetical protein
MCHPSDSFQIDFMDHIPAILIISVGCRDKECFHDLVDRYDIHYAWTRV